MKFTKTNKLGYYCRMDLTWHEYLALQKLVKNAVESRNEEITKRDVMFLAGIRDGMEEKPDE